MKISTKGRYGVRFMLDVAIHAQGGSVTLNDVAERQEISEKYLWQIITPLKSAGLILSERGAKGGYRLARSPEQITLKEIVVQLEGDCGLVECTSRPESCTRSLTCAMRDVWGELSQLLCHAMEATTLASIIKRVKEKESSQVEISYSI